MQDEKPELTPLSLIHISRKLVEVTQQSFFEGIKYAKAGNHLNDISKAIQEYAESFGFGVVRDLVGHGIGTEMHLSLIHISNVMLVVDGKATRVGFEEKDGKKVRVAKTTGKVID